MSIECKHGYLARVCDRCEMEQEIAVARENETKLLSALSASEERILRFQETHKALHRRCQQAEAALVDYRKLTAAPPDGDGVRFIRGSLGRALLAYACSEQQREIERLRAFVQAWDAWHSAKRESPELFAAVVNAREALGHVPD